jgi:hypothetical protein
MGVVPDSSADTLLMYGYAQKGVTKVRLEIDRDEENNGKNQKVIYHLSLEPSVYLKWKAVQEAKKIKSSLFRKTALLALSKAGAPIGMEDNIKLHASNYLPASFSIEVCVDE